MSPPPGSFDVGAFFDALDERRRTEQLSWNRVATQLWELSAELNARRHDHPISPATLTNMRRRGDTTCQHALFMLRWLGRAPEDFVVEPHPDTVGVPLPDVDSAHRLRWDLVATYTALNDARTRHGATWKQTADRLHCTANQLTGLRTAKYATGMRLAMGICQSLRRPAASFVYFARW